MSWTHMQRQGPTRSAWRSWPMVVIILAMIAIVTAVVIMVWPANSRAEGDKKGTLDPPPAPERMDTKPTTPPTGKAPDKQADDPWGPSGALTPKPGDPNANNGEAMANVITKHLCERMAQCANVGSLRAVCDKAIPSATPPSAQPHSAPRAHRHAELFAIDRTTTRRAVPRVVMTKVGLHRRREC
jgi:hypothetical protein